MTQLSIIIVNYNVKYFLEQTLRSCFPACETIRAEIIVVDNHSQDGSVAHIERTFGNGTAQTSLYIIANSENTGFSKANNQGIARANGKYILLLNPDTVIAEDTLVKCIQYFEDHPTCGGMGVRMLDGTGAFLQESKRAFPSPEVAFYKAFGLAGLFPKSKIFGKYHLGYLDEHSTHEVEVLAGAFMMIRSEVLKKIGNLDETYFMYGEDIDLSYRIVEGGYQNIYFADAPILHYKGESTKKASFNYVRMFYTAMKIFVAKHFSGPRAGLFIVFLNTAIYLRAGIAALMRMMGKMAQPIFDSLLFFGGLFAVKYYWEYYVKYIEGGTYPDSYLYINTPLYICIWLLMVFLSGGYDRNTNSGKLIRGMALGTLAIAAVYGFLPEHLRFSRGMIIAGAALNTLLLIISRGIAHLIRHGNFRLGEPPIKRILIAGSASECTRTLQLLQQLQLGNQVIGFANAGKQPSSHPYTLGETATLENLVATYQINELIFCAKDIAHADIIRIMEKLSGKTDFKIVQPDSDAIIGSNSRDTAGDIYTLDTRFAIAQPESIRSKRTLDILIALMGIIGAPVLIWAIQNKPGFLGNCLQVLSGKKTWIGYLPSESQETLPHLRAGILHPLAGSDIDGLNTHICARVNFMYARDYRTSDDVRLIWKHRRLLGNKG